MNNTQLRQLNQVTNKMIINRKMFHARMKDMISREKSDTKAVREQGGRQLHWCKKFRHQRFHPLQFCSGSHNCTILSLSGKRATMCCFVEIQEIGLAPRKIRKSPIWVTSLVRITEIVKCQGSVCKNPNTKVSRAINITKLTFHRSLMVLGWCLHKLGEFIHIKGNIWASHPKRLEATNHLKVHGGIYWCRTICSSQRSVEGKQGRDRFEIEHVMFAQKINNILLLR